MNFRVDPKDSSDKFKPGTMVLYVPYHANGNWKHADCERGVVSTKHCDRGWTIFARFATYAWDPKAQKDLEQYRTPQACVLNQLITKAEYERRYSS